MPAQRAQFLEDPLGNGMFDALIHCLEDAAKLPCVDEPHTTLAGKNGKVIAERMNVEDEPPWRQCSIDLTQDVHDVLRLNSSE